jgi:hypothetical protein
MSSGRNVTLVFYFIIMWVMFLSGSFKSGVEGKFYQRSKVFVYIQNQLPTALMLSCWSSDDNLGN